MDELDQIRNKLSIEEVVAPYVQLKQAGRNFKALCPFHQEKSPSFIISPDKGLAYCFGCRKGGDIFAFIQEVENIEFPEAVKLLAEKAGVELSNNHSGANKQEKDRVLELLTESHQFFQQQLQKNKAAQQYLEQRGYNNEACTKLGLGFAPDSFHELTNALKAKGYSAKEMIDAGVASQKEVGDSNVYDRFRNRIMFPIHTPQGKLVAFGGRTLSKDPQAAKYLNSPETKTYHKGQTLYCFHKAKQSIREMDQAIVTEGYFDALTGHIHGYTNIVASLGTALTEQQLKLISRFTKKVAFAFDADQSGQNAASRSIEIAQKMGLQVRLILIPSGKDPDDAIRSDKDEWELAVANAIQATEYEFQKSFSKHDPTSLEGKKNIVKELLPVINRIPNAIEREHYLKKLGLDLQTSLKSLLLELNKLPKSDLKPLNTEKQQPMPAKSVAYSTIEYLCGVLMNNPEYFEQVQNRIKPEYIGSEQEKNLYKSTLELYNQAEIQSSDTKVNDHEESPKKGRLQLLELYAAERTEKFKTPEETASEIQSICERIRSDYKKRRLKELSIALSSTKNQDETQSLTQEYRQLLENQF